MRLILRCLLILCVLTAAHSATAQLYHPGEVLEYRVSYRAKLIPNTEVGLVQVTTERVAESTVPLFRVTGNARTLASFRWFFQLDDTYTIWVDSATLRTVRFASDLHEGKDYTFRSEYRYDWAARRAHTTWRSRRHTEEQHATIPLSERTMDPVSLYFNLRTLDPDDFAAGDELVLDMLLEDTVRHLRLRYLGREVKKIRRLGRFRTLKFSCELGTSEGFSFEDGSEFLLWLSDDPNHIPLYIESPVKVGSVQAYLVEYRGLKYPLDSRVEKK